MPESLELRLATGDEAIFNTDTRLVDLVDGLLDCGIVIRGEAWISVADIDLVFLGIDLVLADPNTVKKCGNET